MAKARQCAVCLQLSNGEVDCDIDSSLYMCRNCWDIPDVKRLELEGTIYQDCSSGHLEQDGATQQQGPMTASLNYRYLSGNSIDTNTDNNNSRVNYTINGSSQNNHKRQKDNHENINQRSKFVQLAKCAFADDGNDDTNKDDDHGNAEFICIDCWDSLCINCGKAHTKSRLTKHHTIKKLIDVSEDEIDQHEKKTKMHCKVHQSEQIQFYCKDCADAACSLCSIDLHSGHKIMGISKVDEELLTFIENRRKEDEKEKNKYVEEIENLREALAACTTKQTEIVNQVKRETGVTLETLQTNFNIITSACEKVKMDLLNTIQEKTTKRFESEIDKYEANVRELEDRNSFSHLLLRPTSCIIDRVDFIKQIKTKQFAFEKSSLKLEDVFDGLNISTSFIKTHIEFTKQDVRESQYESVSLEDTLDLQSFNEPNLLPASLMSVSNEQLLIMNHYGAIFYLTKSSEKPERIYNSTNATWFEHGIASIYTKFVSLHYLSEDTKAKISVTDAGRLSYNNARDELLITSPKCLYIVKLPADINSQAKDIQPSVVKMKTEESIMHIYAIEASPNASQADIYKIWVLENTPAGDYYMALYSGNVKDEMNEVRLNNSSCPLFENNSLQSADMVFDGVDKVFISDYVNYAVYVFSSDGLYERQLLSRDDDIIGPVSLTFDISLHELYILLEGYVIKKYSLKKVEHNKVCYTLKAII